MRFAFAIFFAAVVIAIACVPTSDPDKGRYACAALADCGDGFDCRPQFDGGGRCYKLGECIDVELCDGVDDNCDGRTDETFPDAGAACATAKLGQCKIGALACVTAAVTCVQTVQPKDELCNTLDDDCDGVVDNGFNLVTDQNNCGSCGVTCDAGTTCGGSSCRESSCGDALDNDQDGLTDCTDDNCLALECATAPVKHCALDAGVPGCF